jgi:hypothetical protein
MYYYCPETISSPSTALFSIPLLRTDWAEQARIAVERARRNSK